MHPTCPPRTIRSFTRGLLQAAAVILLTAAAAPAAPLLTTTAVPATGNLWLAGQSSGGTTHGDTVPVNSPTEVTGLSAGVRLEFFVTGEADHCTSGGCGYAGPDGDLREPIATHLDGSLNFISDLEVPIDAIIGVFLGPDAPTAPAPGVLRFPTSVSRDFGLLLPALQQSFFIGDGLTSGGVRQQFEVPAGATRLFLAAMDGFGWYNNVGGFEVTIAEAAAADVAEPASLTLAVFGLLAAGIRRRTRRR